MKSRWSAVTALAASIRANVVGLVDKLQRRDAARRHAELTRTVRAATITRDFMPLGGWGQDSKGPHRRHPLWPLNHYSTKWHPSARNGAQECARRMLQIARGQLRRENGLAV